MLGREKSTSSTSPFVSELTITLAVAVPPTVILTEDRNDIEQVATGGEVMVTVGVLVAPGGGVGASVGQA